MPHPSPQSHPPFTRILIVRLSAHGDVIHTLPLLTALKEAWPDLHVGWLTETSAVPLLEYHPLIDRLHVVDRKRWLQQGRNPLQWRGVWREVCAMRAALRAEGYEVSLDVQGLLKSAIWPWLADIPHRYGFRATREWADRFYTKRLPPMNLRDSSTPAIQRYLDFASALGAKPSEIPPCVFPPVLPAAAHQVETSLSSIDTSSPMVALAPFTRWASKHWETAYWPRLIALLCEMDAIPVLLGGPGDKTSVAALLDEVSEAHRSRVLNWVGQTDWPTLQALLPRMALLIGPDSAPLHLADALNVPVIGLYGPTAPGRTGPVGKKSTVLSTSLSCQPCFERQCSLKTHDCMKQLTPDMVSAMAKGYLNQHKEARSV